MKKRFAIGAARRNRLFALLTVVLLIGLFGLNLLLTYLGRQHSAYIDLTNEELYTPSDLFLAECDKVLEAEDCGEVRMIFCADPDTLEEAKRARVPYFMALKMQDRYDNFKVETVNVTLNPTAVSAFKTTSLTAIDATNVILAYGDRYRIATINGYWLTDESNALFSYNGEYTMVTQLRSLVLSGKPSAYLVTDHGTSYFDPADPESQMSRDNAALYDLLVGQGLQVKTLSLAEADAIPADCALLVLNDPREDFAPAADADIRSFSYVSDLEKIDRYLIHHQGALMVAKDYRLALPELDAFLCEWGFRFGDGQVRDAASCLNGDAETLVTEYVTEKNSYAYTIYGELASLTSAPISVVTDSGSVECSYWDKDYFSDAGVNSTRVYSPFLRTSASSMTYNEAGELTGTEAQRALAGVTARMITDDFTGKAVYSYVFCAASRDFFSNALLGDTSFGNASVSALLIKNISRVDDYATTDLGGDSLNSISYGGKQLLDSALSASDYNVYTKDYKSVLNTTSEVEAEEFVAQYEKQYKNLGLRLTRPITAANLSSHTLTLFAVPLAIAIAGIVLCLRRKYR